MLAKVHSMGLHGIEAYAVEVEVYVTRSEVPRATLVGLPDASVKESIDRVRAALRNTGYHLPSISATVNLAPADRRKEGPAFELPIALGLLQAVDAVQFDSRGRYAVVGELALAWCGRRHRPTRLSNCRRRRCRARGRCHGRSGRRRR